MKVRNLALTTFVLGSMAAISSCSTMPGQTQSGQEIAAQGPTVMNPRVEPGTVELNTQLMPQQPARITADVKDFRANVQDVKLKFVDVPITIAMEQAAGTTWSAQIPQSQLRQLAVAGKTVKYEAQIIARNDKGQVATGKDTVEIKIKTPKLTPTG